ncbi:hypothetical protein MSUIS_02210 [Mycoplasma suis KI3806]|uniref:Uncharacterized protein n=1 Tax=Mycoplasma suis (strain KI_3806) TaxID=708248 RepID=F0V392_MYCS3|nr:hypothetical protein MSUIS_02210 [Mycoplasma suis KI3806]
MLFIYKLLLGAIGTVTTGGLLGAAYKYSVDQFNDDSDLREMSNGLSSGNADLLEPFKRTEKDGSGDGSLEATVKGESGTLKPDVGLEARNLQDQLQGVVDDVTNRASTIRLPNR